MRCEQHMHRLFVLLFCFICLGRPLSFEDGGMTDVHVEEVRTHPYAACLFVTDVS
jgi:hypothetical protein